MKTIEQIKQMKGKEKISVLTCYDAAMAKLLDGQVDMLLAGDSLGMVMLGENSTAKVTMNDMRSAFKSVSNGAKNTLLIGDLPANSYNNPQDALKHAQEAISAGIHAVKIENKAEIAKALTKENIPVMGHVGLTPQTITSFKVQGKEQAQADQIIEEAKALERAGCFSMVLECIPASLAEKITKKLAIPTIGIGAGVHCDGQVLVTHDMLGLFEDFKPKFVKRYRELAKEIKTAAREFDKEVKENQYPSNEHTYS